MKRDREGEEELQNEICLLRKELETYKKQKMEEIQKKEKELMDKKRKNQKNILLCNVETKEEVDEILKTYRTEEIKISLDGESLDEIIFDKSKKHKDGNCAIYYQIKSKGEFVVLPYDKDGLWEKKMDKLDQNKNLVQIYAK